jgi:hypothetical protein
MQGQDFLVDQLGYTMDGAKSVSVDSYTMKGLDILDGTC